MIVDGRALAARRTDELKVERAQFGPLSLGIVVMQEDAVTTSFLRIKSRTAAALDIEVRYVPTLEDALQYDGVILQLPLPRERDPEQERNRIPPEKDVDILSDAAYEKFVQGAYPPPPVPRAMDYIMKSYDISYRNKHVVVVGQGRLVGKPAAELFRQRGAQVTVLERGDDLAPVRDADIVVLGAGVSGLIKAGMVREGVIILDAGTSESSGAIVGDADPECEKKASLMTPVPGGIGPIAVVEIFANLFALKRLHGA